MQIATDVPARTKWCQICGRYNASPVDVLELRRLLAAVGSPKPEAPGQAHPGCMIALRRHVQED